MKINAPVKINISELKANVDPSVKVETIKADLKAEGAHVAGYRDEDGTLVMVISGDIDVETIEAVFDEDAQVDFNEFVIDDIELIDAETVKVFDNKNVKNEMKKALSEKKKDCCPTKPKKKKEMMISLSEAFQGKNASGKKVTLDNVIDSMAGHKLMENAAINAINKAKAEAKDSYLVEKLGKEKYNMIVESLEADKTSIHGNVKVNGKKIEEYTTDELVGLLEKVSRQISGLEEKVGAGLNETDAAKLNKELDTKKKIQNILDEEISFRNALEAIKEDDNDGGFDFKDLNPETVDSDKSDKDEKKESKEDDKSDEEKDSDDKEENPDEDEEVEIGNIIITLDSKKSAEELKNDLIDAGIPEDVIEIEPVEDDTENDDEKSEDSEEDDEKEEKEEKESEDANESVKIKKGNKINEDDSEESAEDDEKSEEEKSDDYSEDDEDSENDEEATGSYKLVLTDTDYAPQMSDVLQDIWGLTKEEFEEMIGGEIVAADDEDSSDDDKEDKTEGEDKSDDSDEDDDSLDDFDPDEIFKDL